MKSGIRTLAVVVLLAGFGSAAAADSSTSSSDYSICFAPSEFSLQTLVADLGWRANCVLSRLITM